MVVAVLNLVAGVLLASATVMLLLRTMIGRWPAVAGCSASIVSCLISAGMFASMSGYTYNSSGTNAFSVVFPIATLMLVLLPSTTAWIQAKRLPVPAPYHPSPVYPHHPGYPI